MGNAMTTIAPDKNNKGARMMGSPVVKRVQAALKAMGFRLGPVDGVWGRKTVAAAKAFQAAKGLKIDGVVGPRTSKALFRGVTPSEPGQQSAGPALVWFEEAQNLLGTKEIGGAASNPTILDWADDLDIHYPNDDIPWCGLFVAHCVGATLPDEVLPGNPLGARRWSAFGEATDPRLGAIMVFWRKSKSSGLGHVGFYNGESDDAYQILGGNQSNAVSLAWLSKDRFLQARWPSTARSLTSAAVTREKAGGLSSNEA
ncbi:MAG: TIGR02594 family protein [Caulobacterales bacterium]|nr:TIGR02594 family protein [Caulobacterales bacterium]